MSGTEGGDHAQWYRPGALCFCGYAQACLRTIPDPGPGPDPDAAV